MISSKFLVTLNDHPVFVVVVVVVVVNFFYFFDFLSQTDARICPTFCEDVLDGPLPSLLPLFMDFGEFCAISSNSKKIFL